MSNTGRRNKIVGRIGVWLGTIATMGAFLVATTKASIASRNTVTTQGGSPAFTSVVTVPGNVAASPPGWQASTDFRTRSS